jgi:hypothetical protein
MGCWEVYISCLLDEIFYRHQLGPFDLWYHLVLGFLCWFFCLDDLPIGKRGILTSPSTIVLESICAFKSFSVCLMKQGALALGAYRLIVVTFFWCIAPFISMECPSLSCVTNVSLKSTLSDISITTPAFLGSHWLGNLFPACYPKPVFISVNKIGLLLTTDCQIFLFNPLCWMVSFDGGVEPIDIQC